MTEPEIRAVVFDLDGTLVDSTQMHIAVWTNAVTPLGISLPARVFRSGLGAGYEPFLDMIATAAGQTIGPSQRSALIAEHETALIEMSGNAQALPGAAEIWQSLTESGIPYAVATSASPAAARTMVVDVLGGVNVPIITSNDVKHPKPAPDIILAAAARLDLEPTQIIVVGDSVWDMRAAATAGAQFIGIGTGSASVSEFADEGATAVSNLWAAAPVIHARLGLPRPRTSGNTGGAGVSSVRWPRFTS